MYIYFSYSENDIDMSLSREFYDINSTMDELCNGICNATDMDELHDCISSFMHSEYFMKEIKQELEEYTEDMEDATEEDRITMFDHINDWFTANQNTTYTIRALDADTYLYMVKDEDPYGPWLILLITIYSEHNLREIALKHHYPEIEVK